MRFRHVTIGTILIATVLRAALLQAQVPASVDAAQRRLALERLTVLGSVLVVGAHPDDENTALLAFLAKGRKLRTAYLSLTRGDGGQNLIGTEQGELLGVLRTEELLAARRIDGAQQFFTRAIDFGYSKSPEETLRIWGHDAVLADVVWVIRSFRPDVIITRFPTTGEGGHGHHTASAILAGEAFSAAADPARFPEQLRWVKPWQAKRLLWNAWRPSGSEKAAPARPGISVDLGAYDPLLGWSWTELAAASRSMHKSQGFGTAPRRGPFPNEFVLVAGEPPQHDLFDGIETSWKRVPGRQAVGATLERAVAGLDDEHPAASVPVLLEALAALDRLEPEPWDPWIGVKRRELLDAIRDCVGLWLDASADNLTATPGSSIGVTAVALNRSATPLKLVRVEFPFTNVLHVDRPAGAARARTVGGGAGDLFMPLDDNQPVTLTTALRLPRDLSLSRPYWLSAPHGEGTYTIPEQALVGLPENPPAVVVTFVIRAGEQELRYQVPVVFHATDPVEGERTRELAIVPPLTVNLEAPVLLFPDAGARVVRASVRCHQDTLDATLHLRAPAGWQVEPNAVPLAFPKRGQEREVTFTVTPPTAPASVELNATVEVGGVERPARGLVEIDHPHITPQILLPPTAARLVRVEVARPVKRIGYVMGPGDEVPGVLRRLGFEVTLLDDDALLERDLSGFDAIVTGVRAYNTQPRLAEAEERLLAYAQRGGTLVVQYNHDRDLVTDRLGPYPLTLSRDRITDETAPVTFSVPESPLLVWPNRITAADFSGWIQERGLYFPHSWDDRYQAPLAMADPGEAATRGALLFARVGKGAFVYTGLAFFRQLPAGVPGAIRLFVNLLASGKHAG